MYLQVVVIIVCGLVGLTLIELIGEWVVEHFVPEKTASKKLFDSLSKKEVFAIALLSLGHLGFIVTVTLLI